MEVLFEEDKRCEVIRSGAAEIIPPGWMKSLDLGEAVCWGLTSLSHFAEQNVLLVLLSLRKLQGFLQTLYQELGTETKYIFSILSQKRLKQWQKEVENINTLP